MGNLKNAALFWCKIKSYIILFLAVIAGVLFIGNLIQTKSGDPQKAKQAKQGTMISGIMATVFLVIYFVLQTNIGCGLSIAGNVYQLAR